jgi:hypothetical protein
LEERWALMLKIVFEHTNSPLLHTIKISLKTSLLGNVHARAKFFFFPLLISIKICFLSLVFWIFPLWKGNYPHVCMVPIFHTATRDCISTSNRTSTFPWFLS